MHAPYSPFKFELKFNLRAKLVIQILLILCELWLKFAEFI